MSRVLLACLTLLLSLSALSQSSFGTAVTKATDYYFDATPAVATLTTHSLISTSGETFFGCAGSQTVCWVKFNIPTPANTSLSTRSVKIEVTGASFTPVIDFFDASNVWMECATGTVLKTDPVANPVNPTTDYYVRISSTTASAGATFSLGIQYYPVAELRNTYTPTASGDPNGYSTCDQTRRNNVAASGSSLVQATRYTFTPITTPNSGSCTTTINSNTSILLLDQMSCVCYGIDYLVTVELRVDNHWCGSVVSLPLNMQVGGTTNITTANNTTVPFSGSINATFACAGAVYEWEFTTQNGTAISYTTNSPTLPLTQATCLRFNRIYQVRVRVTACGIVGPWCGIDGEAGTPCTFFTPPIYTIPVPTAPIGSGPGPNNYCYAQAAPNSLVDVDFYPGIDQYIFQFTRVVNAAPFNPISNPVIVFSNTSGCGLSTGQCLAGRTYRLGIKPGITSCGSPQQGDYSPWCYFSVSPAPAPTPGMITEVFDETFDYETITKVASENAHELSFEVLGNQSQRVLVVSTNEQPIEGRGEFVLYDLNGRIAYQQTLNNATGVTILQLTLPQDLSTGIYIAKVTSSSYAQTGKIFLASN